MTRRALCTGIDRFRSPDLLPLKGAENDARTVSTVLVREFGFAPENVRVLLGERATRDNWLTALDGILAMSVPGDEVLVFTSSYGSQADDENNDEADGSDEVLVTWDHDPYGNPLRDDEIALHLNQLRDGVSVAFVWDTCNAGTMDDGTRALSGPTRSDSMAEYAASWGGKFLAPIVSTSRSIDRSADKKPPKKRAKTGGRTNANATGPLARAVSFSACADGETAADGSFGGIPMGAFTFAFLDVLRRTRQDVTWEELLKKTKSTLKSLGFKQTPQLSLPPSLKDRPAFWGRSRRGGSAPRASMPHAAQPSSQYAAPQPAGFSPAVAAMQGPWATAPQPSAPAPWGAPAQQASSAQPMHSPAVDPRTAMEQHIQALEASGRWSEAVTALWQHVGALGNADDKVKVLEHIAKIYREVFNDERSALETLERVLALVPSNPSVLASLFAAYAKQGNFARISQLQQWLTELATGKKSR